MSHQFEISVGAQWRAFDRQSGSEVNFPDTRHIRIRQPAQTAGQVGGHDRPRGDGFAMQPRSIAQAGLYRMAEGVPQVQCRSFTLLGFVSGNHLGLVTAGTLDRFGQCGRIARHQTFQIGLDPFKEGQVANQAVFDDFGHTRSQFAIRQSVEH